MPRAFMAATADPPPAPPHWWLVHIRYGSAHVPYGSAHVPYGSAHVPLRVSACFPAQLKSCVLHPPDEKTNILRCAEFVEKRKAKLRAKRIALGLSPDAPVSLDDMEEEDDEEDSEDEAEAEEFLRRAEHNKRAERFDTFKDINRRKKEDAEGDREKGAYLFKNGENEAALQKFEESIGKNPDEFRAHLNRAATFLKLDMPRRAVLSADRALHLTEGKEAKCYYRRAAAWLACGEFNECIADCDAAKRLEPADKAIAALRKKGEEERENATWGFSADSRAVEKLEEQVLARARHHCAPLG